MSGAADGRGRRPVLRHLEPQPGEAYLDPEEVVRRLRDEFSYVDADRDRGEDVVGDIIAKLIEVHAPQAILDSQLAGQDRSYHVEIADDGTSDDYIGFILQPDTGIRIRYRSAEHEEAVQPLLRRCAEALNYRLVIL